MHGVDSTLVDLKIRISVLELKIAESDAEIAKLAGMVESAQDAAIAALRSAIQQLGGKS